MLYLLSGTDRFRLSERREQLEQEFRATTPDGSLSRFDIEETWDEATQSRIAELLTSDGLFAIPRLLLIRGLETLSDRDGEWLATKLRRFGPTHTGVLSFFLLPKKQYPRWWQTLAQLGQQETYTSDGTDAARRIATVLAEYGVTIVPAAKTILIEAFGKDMGRLTQECVRLALTAHDKTITPEQITREVELPKEYNVFAALDCLIRGDRPKAISLFRVTETEPEAAFALLGLCAWQVRRLIAVKELAEQENMSAPAIAKELKTSPYPIQKTLPLLPKLSFPRLRQALTLLADFDQAVKSGRMQPGVALDLFVWKF